MLLIGRIVEGAGGIEVIPWKGGRTGGIGIFCCRLLYGRGEIGC